MTEPQLIYGCLQQDRLSQKQVYTNYGAKVLGICRRYMKDRERAEEMVMNTFLQVFNKIAQYKNEGSFEGWILRIAVNCCLMELRKKTTFDVEVAQDTIQLPANDTTDAFFNDDIEAMLKTLPDGARIVFNLYAVEGYKHHEIAEQLGISEGTSKSQLHYAKEKLKKTFFSANTPKTASHGR
jgi:RNA polymerase sigma-70 factor (ECF subfamily)